MVSEKARTLVPSLLFFIWLPRTPTSLRLLMNKINRVLPWVYSVTGNWGDKFGFTSMSTLTEFAYPKFTRKLSFKVIYLGMKCTYYFIFLRNTVCKLNRKKKMACYFRVHQILIQFDSTNTGWIPVLCHAQGRALEAGEDMVISAWRDLQTWKTGESNNMVLRLL